MRIFLTRWSCLDVASNLARVPREARVAADGGARLAVFPESFLHGYSRIVEPARVRGVFGETSARHPEVAFVFGSFSEERRNRMTVWQAGREIARYDKVHLFPPNGELQIWDPGDRYVALRLDDWTLGLINCNDIRFPEQARALRMQAKADLFVTVAWWPWRRDHVWSALLRARAIENAAFCLGCCVAGSEDDDERFAGAGNHVFDPLGDPVSAADEGFYELDRRRFEQVIVDPLENFVEIGDVEIY
jgi:predicted amidohydrolase